MPEELAGKNKICSASSLEGVKFTYKGKSKDAFDKGKGKGFHLTQFFSTGDMEAMPMAMLVIPADYEHRYK